VRLTTSGDALANIEFDHFSAVVRLYRFVMRTEAAPKKSQPSVAAGLAKVARAAHSEEFGGVHGSARPLLRHDAAGQQQQQRDDGQRAAHAAAFKECCFSVALIPATSRSTTTMLGAFMYPRAMREMVL
jgi:hypothetical protein